MRLWFELYYIALVQLFVYVHVFAMVVNSCQYVHSWCIIMYFVSLQYVPNCRFISTFIRTYSCTHMHTAVLPSGPSLNHLTKNRTSKHPARRPPTAETRRKISREQTSHPISPLAKESHYPPTTSTSELEPSGLDYWMLKETTV